MKTFQECKNIIRNCSKCGLCQSVCPIYEITKNDCTVSRGHFIMLQGLLKGDLNSSKTINHYLDLCLKCGACSKFCPSEIDAVNINLLAKAECIQYSIWEKFISFIQKYFILDGFFKVISCFKKSFKSQSYSQKVLYFGGCGSKLKGNSSVIKLLNACNIEVLTPDFDCCGVPFLMRGDINSYYDYLNKFIRIIEDSEVKEIVTTCASCEKTLKDYVKWSDNPSLKLLKIKNIFEYIRENNLKLKLQKSQKITFHKPCHIENWKDLKWILCNTENLEYIEMENYDSCCGLNGILKIDKLNTFKHIFNKKRRSIINTNAKTVLTSCLGCELALKIYSLDKYKVKDFTEFLAENL